MKKFLNRLLILLFVSIFLVPTFVLADDEEEEEETVNDPVMVYVFRGEGCSHCEEALEWFDEIEEEYGEYFTLVTYEVWYDENNATLMEYVAEQLDEEPDGVPYIIIGDVTYNGFDEEDEDEILEVILNEYENDERIDIVEQVITLTGWTGSSDSDSEEDDSNTANIIIVVVTVIIVVGIVIIVIKARED